jgi:glycosyltransferase involved in cell wall biosynthesis
MKKIIIYSPGAFQLFGHSYDYTKGLSESFHELGYEVYVFGIDGPLKFNDFVNEIKIIKSINPVEKITLFQKIKWGFHRIKDSTYFIKKFLNFYFTFEEKPLIIFETFEYFSLSMVIKKFSDNYFCIFHDTNFNFQQTSLLAGLYKRLARISSNKIVKYSKKSFVHGNEMKLNFIDQMGKSCKDKIMDIPYGAPLPFKVEKDDMLNSKSLLGLKMNKNYLLSFGTLRSDKEFIPIMEALEKDTNWEWLIAGPEGDYTYNQIKVLAKKYKLEDRIIMHHKFIENKDQKLFFTASDLVINLYKPYIRHESGTAQLARAYNKPVVVSGPPDLTDYVVEKNIGWVVDEKQTVTEVLKKYVELPENDMNLIHSNINELAINNSWITVAKKILSFN